MKLPYQMSSDQPHARLYQLADGRFQVVKDGEIAPLMIGFGYVLVERDLAQYLVDLDLPGVDIIDAVIYEPWRKEEIYSHQQLRIDQHFSSDRLRYDDPHSCPDVVRDINLDGERFLLMDYQNVFVSDPLRQRLEASRFEYLRFTEGLDGFVGAET